MMLYDDTERDMLTECVVGILKRRYDIWRSQIDEKMDEVRELLND
jgi:hypothetical protein